VLDRTVGAWVPESSVSDLLIAVEREKPGIQIGSYPFWREGRIGANFVIRSREQTALDDAAARLMDALSAAGHDPLDGAI
jgi:molybdopterin-biosynthesis enzyme MoeA-like protein